MSKVVDALKEQIINEKQWNSWSLVMPVEFEHRVKNGQGVWLVKVRCSCGTEEFIRTRNLRVGRSKACRGCYHRGSLNVNWSGYHDMPGDLIHRTKHSAKARNIKWKLDNKSLFDLYERQDRKCALSGVNLDWETASVDRIDSKLPYIKTNIQWVHKKVNVMKHVMSVDEFIGWCNLITKNSK